MNHRIKWLSSICYAPMMLALVTSCAEGVDDNERFSAGVSNTQLESPELDPTKFKTQINADGSESVEVTWSVIFGAGGYLANVQDVTNPANPVAIIKDSVIDGCRFSFPRLVDTKYEISVSTLGNEQLNNTASTTPSVVAYSTFLPATIIPRGSDIAQFIAENFQESADEVAFELEAGQNYTLSGTVDFNLTPVTLRGDKYNRPYVEIIKQGCISTQAGLKIKNINFDMSAAEAQSFIALSSTPSESITTEALGFKALGANQNCYVIMGQISVESCNFRNMPGSILWGNKQPYSMNDFRITDCIVQLNNSTSATFINLWDSSISTGTLKTMTLKNSTFYNLVENNSAYFFRYANPSSADPQKTFGTGATSTHTIDHCTFDRTFTGKDFANNMPTVNRFEVVFTNNVFYDVFRIYQYIRSTTVLTKTENNVVWGNFAGIPNNNDLKYAENINPEFVGPTIQEFNLDEAKGGVNYRPQNATCADKKMGDPRWYE
ncbi:DUF4992 family lipoprotein [uncultured Duncaniella sp.]|uniref:DUF4992 family lipoprotein n=1 Tax=uncultured Duncaniella sp. TaxID=2768039 RepID=UPI0025EB3FC4|nr:DUF4992 family lipoprotein [uncultured Duncaniella sp.]